MQSLTWYRNGNYQVVINKDTGTKIRICKEDTLVADFPENIDIKITNYCEMGCPMCHESSSTKGKHADILNIPFIDTLQKNTELAIGGGAVTSHPDLPEFLKILKSRDIIANITIHQKELKEKKAIIQYWIDKKLVSGVGISLHDYDEEVIAFAQKNSNVVIHTIAGYTSYSLYEKLQDKNIKILILGYKDFRRGHTYNQLFENVIKENISVLSDMLPQMLSKYRAVSFDNLAIKQLEVSAILTSSQFKQFYMGDDSNFTMYVDLVNQQYAGSSTVAEDKRLPIEKDIKDMFKKIRNTCN